MIDKEIIIKIENELCSFKKTKTKASNSKFYYQKINAKYNAGTKIFKIGLKTLFFAYKTEKFLINAFGLNRTNILFSDIYLNLIRKLFIIYNA